MFKQAFKNMDKEVQQNFPSRTGKTAFFIILHLLNLIFLQTMSIAEDKSDKLVASLKTHVLKLTGTDHPRSYKNMESLNAAADYIEAELQNIGVTPENQKFKLFRKTYRNILCRIESDNPKTVLLGAHYDVWGAGPGADDNASGIAGLIELARMLYANKEKLQYSVEIIAFTNEEPPFFRTKNMGSYIHAQSILKRKEMIEYVIVLEMIGFYSEIADSQDYPLPSMRQIYPSTGNFIAIVGNNRSSDIIVRITQAIQKNAMIECQSLIAPAVLQGMDFSDHLNYWNLDMKALMITDTAFYRNKNYHQSTDRPETLNYSKMAEVVKGLATSFYRTMQK